MRVGERVRHIKEEDFLKYGVLEVWDITGVSATCRYGDFGDVNIITIALTELKLMTR